VLKAYLAGPDIFHPDHKAIYALMKALCAEKGVVAFAPGDHVIERFPGELPARFAKRIRFVNMRAITFSDFVIANVSPFRGINADDGTAWESGYATGLGKPVFSYSRDERSLLVRASESFGSLTAGPDNEWHDWDGTVVENFGLKVNLMLVSGNTDGIHGSFAAALEAAVTYFGRKGLT
jgi:nucleoside 2-deoxyribosyltransferase